MIYVFDASYVGALIIPDENELLFRKQSSVIINEEEKYVPQLLWYEAANLLMNLIRRKRIKESFASKFFKHLTELNLKTDFETGAAYSQKLFDLSSEFNLSSYDAAYLELAKRKKAVLCTLDRKLIAAAGKCGVKIIR